MKKTLILFLLLLIVPFVTACSNNDNVEFINLYSDNPTDLFKKDFGFKNINNPKNSNVSIEEQLEKNTGIETKYSNDSLLSILDTENGRYTIKGEFADMNEGYVKFEPNNWMTEDLFGDEIETINDIQYVRYSIYPTKEDNIKNTGWFFITTEFGKVKEIWFKLYN